MLFDSQAAFWYWNLFLGHGLEVFWAIIKCFGQLKDTLVNKMLGWKSNSEIGRTGFAVSKLKIISICVKGQPDQTMDQIPFHWIELKMKMKMMVVVVWNVLHKLLFFESAILILILIDNSKKW